MTIQSIPVSYTHLDVYKRQIHNWGIFIEYLLNTLIHIHTKGSILDILPAYYQTYRILDKKMEKIDTTQQDMLFHKMCLARAIAMCIRDSPYSAPIKVASPCGRNSLVSLSIFSIWISARTSSFLKM